MTGITNMRRSSGFAHVGLLIAFFVCAAAVGAAYYSVSNQNNETKEKTALQAKTTITNFEQCVDAQGMVGTEDDAASYSKATDVRRVFWCSTGMRPFHYAKFERCSIGKCRELETALLSYCNNEYITLKKLGPSAKLALAYSEPALISEGYARASVRCNAGEPDWYTKKPTLVFMKQNDKKWGHYLTPSEASLCSELDGKNIPRAIAGACYNPENSKYRGPKFSS